MLETAYFLAKIGPDTSENEQHFAEILPIGRRVADRCRHRGCALSPRDLNLAGRRLGGDGAVGGPGGRRVAPGGAGSCRRRSRPPRQTAANFTGLRFTLDFNLLKQYHTAIPLLMSGMMTIDPVEERRGRGDACVPSCLPQKYKQLRLLLLCLILLVRVFGPLLIVFKEIKVTHR